MDSLFESIKNAMSSFYSWCISLGHQLLQHIGTNIIAFTQIDYAADDLFGYDSDDSYDCDDSDDSLGVPPHLGTISEESSSDEEQ